MAKTKPDATVEALPKARPEKKGNGPDAVGPVHRVLYMNGQPIFAARHDDDDTDDEIAAMKLEKLNAAKASGAVRPVFRVVTEQNGEPVEVV